MSEIKPAPTKDSYSSVGCTGSDARDVIDKPRSFTCCIQAGEPAPSSRSSGQRGKVPKSLEPSPARRRERLAEITAK